MEEGIKSPREVDVLEWVYFISPENLLLTGLCRRAHSNRLANSTHLQTYPRKVITLPSSNIAQ